MKRSMWIIFILLLTSCTPGSNTPLPTPSEQQSMGPIDVKSEKPMYLDEAPYKTDDMHRRLISIINENARALNSRNENAYISSFTPKESNAIKLAKSGYDYLTGEKSLIIKLENPIFQEQKSKKEELVVNVDRTIKDEAKQTSVTSTSMYIFELIDGQWELAFID